MSFAIYMFVPKATTKMANKHYNASYNKGNAKIHVNLDVITWQEEGVFYYFSPALDLIGYGQSDEEAQQSFEIMLAEFVDYTHNKRTMFDELERLGWTVNKRKKRMQPPNQEELLQDNEEYRNLMNRQDIKTTVKSEVVAF